MDATLIRSFFAVLLASAAAACSSKAGGPGGTDSSTGQPDALPADLGTSIPDSGMAIADAGPSDSGTGGQDAAEAMPERGQPQVSRTLALGENGKSLWVVNPDSDSVSEINIQTRTLVREILLAPSAPSVDMAGRYEPALRPRALAVVPSLQKIYVAAQSANRVLVVDEVSGVITASVAVGAEPVAVVATRDGSAVFVVSHQAALVQKIDTQTNRVVLSVPVTEHPWGASLRADESLLYVSHLLIGTGVTVIRTDTLEQVGSVPFPKRPAGPTHNHLLPSGESRGAYTAVPRPDTGDIWVPHLLLATDTAEPTLDFQSTVFPSITILRPGGAGIDQILDLRPNTVLTATGAFTDVVSGPRDVAFTPDGQVALMVNAQSEDVMVFDGAMRFEIGLVRPTPSALIEGVLIVPDGSDPSGNAHAFIQGRSTHNLTVLAIVRAQSRIDVTVEGAAIDSLASDPMPADMRRGERLFYSSNSAAFPITQNFWVACGSCHLEGQSDAVVWRFLEGPRDTPSNAGGPINTGFLLRQASRNGVVDYDETIRLEQGGSYHRTNAAQLPDLQAIAKFTNFAIPFPQNPNRSADGTLTAQQDRGRMLFETACGGCHSGPYLTDSGSGNPTLDLSGPILLHDIGTCVRGGSFPDQPAMDIEGHPRTACDFDTPTLRGIFATAPYFHDGSAVALDDVVARLPASAGMGADQRADLVAYLKTL